MYDLRNGPLALFDVFNLGRGKCVLAYSMHPILTDQWTSKIFHDTPCGYYNGQVNMMEFTTTAELVEHLKAQDVVTSTVNSVDKWCSVLEDV